MLALNKVVRVITTPPNDTIIPNIGRAAVCNITFDMMNSANPTDPCSKNVLRFLVLGETAYTPYETISKLFQIETAGIPAIDQSGSSLEIFPLGRT